TLSYSPMRDDRGQVAGLLGVISETTERVLAERRLRTLRALATHAASAGTATVTEVAAGAIATLAQNRPDVPYALLYLTGEDGRARLIALDGVDRGSQAAPEVVRPGATDAPWPVGAPDGGTVTIPTPAASFGPRSGGVWAEPSPRAALVPLRRAGLDGFLVVG